MENYEQWTEPRKEPDRYLVSEPEMVVTETNKVEASGHGLPTLLTGEGSKHKRANSNSLADADMLRCFLFCLSAYLG